MEVFRFGVFDYSDRPGVLSSDGHPSAPSLHMEEEKRVIVEHRLAWQDNLYGEMGTYIADEEVACHE